MCLYKASTLERASHLSQCEVWADPAQQCLRKGTYSCMRQYVESLSFTFVSLVALPDKLDLMEPLQCITEISNTDNHIVQVDQAEEAARRELAP